MATPDFPSKPGRPNRFPLGHPLNRPAVQQPEPEQAPEQAPVSPANPPTTDAPPQEQTGAV